MKFANYHTHTKYDDGKGEIEEYVSKAIRNNIAILGFSPHAPLPNDPPWPMLEVDFENYSRDIDEIRLKYQDILILKGLEVDYIESVMSVKNKSIIDKNLDYTVGAVHVIGDYSHGKYVPITGHSEKFKTSVINTYDGDIEFSVKEYFRVMREMLKSAPPDITAHFDLIKKVNIDYNLFDEKAPWYLNEILDTLNVLKDTNSILEINTGALTRKKANELFPSDYILNEIVDSNIPVVINSDCHQPDYISGLFNETYRKIQKMGFRKVRFLGKEGYRDYEINEVLAI